MIDVGGRLVTPGLIETHLHLDKSCILERCRLEKGDLAEVIGEVARAKREFTAQDVYERGKRTLEKCVPNGVTHVRTHVEMDPVIGLKGLEGVSALAEEYKWAVDIEVCVFPQEGLLNNPGTSSLMVEGLRNGGAVIGAAPYTDTHPHGQIDRVFQMAREFDVDIDMHLDFDLNPEEMDLDYVCELTDRFGYGQRVAIGHATKLSSASRERLVESARRMADAGVALTVLPATDLFLMGRGHEQNVPRGVTPSCCTGASTAPYRPRMSSTRSRPLATAR